MPWPWQSRTTEREAADRRRLDGYHRGIVSEWLAAGLLLAKGYRIHARRYKTPVGEIDLIVRRRRRLAFVEVKRRDSFDAALLSVTPRSQARLRRAAEHWLARHPAHQTLDLGFDLVLITPRRWPRHIMDALRHAERTP